MQAVARKFCQVEGRTWILAVAIYGAWAIAREHLFKPVFIPVHPTV